MSRNGSKRIDLRIDTLAVHGLDARQRAMFLQDLRESLTTQLGDPATLAALGPERYQAGYSATLEPVASGATPGSRAAQSILKGFGS